MTVRVTGSAAESAVSGVSAHHPDARDLLRLRPRAAPPESL